MPSNIVNIDFWNLFQLQPGDRVLDLGSGNGRHTIEAANWDVDVVSVDLMPGELARSRYMFHAEKDNGVLRGDAHFAISDAQYLPFADNSFDKVMATEVLEHVFDDERAMREIYRVTKPGGEVAISCPHHRAERYIWGISWDYWHSPGGHIRIYRKGELIRRLTETGFTMGETRGRHAYQSVYWFLRCVFGKDNPNFLITRSFWSFINWHLDSRNALSEGLEGALDHLIPKDYVVYGRKPGQA